MKENVFGNPRICYEIERHSHMNDVAVNVLSQNEAVLVFQFFCLCSALATSRKEIQRAVIQDCHAIRFVRSHLRL